eukprot:TRINITY_DN895_c0_g1_i1.p1 TRINITY_DN895_c0_g1~~TRINITY_DN895_c0_g1_i1.p1  ORF type:complete len:451 (-),score=58.31 TRINITY_DN895_c0_g1_i1:98-1450(-)
MDRRKFAITIGQNDYSNCDRLDKAVNDSNELAKTLDRLGFYVVRCNNSSRKEMRTAIKKFHQMLTPYCLAVFYFSGYSMQQEGNNFLVPVDADVGISADVDDDCVSLNWIIRGMTETEGCLSAVLLEAARGNPFEFKWRSNTVPSYKGLATMKPPPGCLLAFSAEPGSTVSFEYTQEDNAVFTSALLECVGTPDVNIVDCMREVRQRVLEATTDNRNNLPPQVAWIQSRLMDDFFFNRTQGRPVSPTKAARPPTHSPTSSPRNQPERVRSRSPQRAFSPRIKSGAAYPTRQSWYFSTIAHRPDWQDAVVEVVRSRASHPSTTLDGNCVVGIEPCLEPPRVDGDPSVFSVRLKFVRGPYETDSAHSVELVGYRSVYTNDTPSLTFELPNVQNCVARFDVDFANDTMTMITNDNDPPVSLPISDLAEVGVRPPYQLVVYMWDSGSTVELLSP